MAGYPELLMKADPLAWLCGMFGGDMRLLNISQVTAHRGRTEKGEKAISVFLYDSNMKPSYTGWEGVRRWNQPTTGRHGAPILPL